MSKIDSIHDGSVESEKGDAQTITITDIDDKDQALRLVGLERTEDVSEERYRQVRRKLDLVIPPLCAAVYCTQYLDKNVLNYASIMGLPITGQDYNLVALAFYLGFFIWVFPTMYISQKLRLGKYLGTNVVLWGSHHDAACRSKFVRAILHPQDPIGNAGELRRTKSDINRVDVLQEERTGYPDILNGVASIFGGFVAYGISFDSSPRLAPYKIMYLLCGALAIVVGVAVLLWMPDSPLHARFLSRQERIAAVERIRSDQGGTENKKIKKVQIIEALLDIRTWLIVLSTLVTSIPNGSLSNFGNIVIKSFGYTSRQSLILSTPAGVIGILSALICGWYSDRKNERMLPIVWGLIPTIVGAAMLVSLKGPEHKGALLFANYIIGTFGSSLAIIYAYNASNTSGYTKKVTINAMTLAAFCAGNIIGAETFLPKDAPNYIPGKTAILVLLCSQLFICFLLRWINLHLNKKKRQLIGQMKEQNNWTDDDVEKERQRHAFLDMTDIHTKLTREALHLLPSSSSGDKTDFIAAFVSSQREFRKFYALEGRKSQAAWKQSTTGELDQANTKETIDAGFSTPVAKARLPDAQPLNAVLQPQSPGSPIATQPKIHKRKEKETRVKANDGPGSDGDVKGRPNARVMTRSSQKTLEETFAKQGTKNTKKRSRSSDSEHQALLAERRERRRAKRDIVEPQAKKPRREDMSAKVQVDKASKKTAKAKSVNVAAGLALMHGFSATNVGPSRLTLKPSFGVFQKGRASEHTKVRKSQKPKAVSNRWSEASFLKVAGDTRKKEDNASSESSSSSDRSSLNSGRCVSRPGNHKKTKLRKGVNKPVPQSTPSDASVDRERSASAHSVAPDRAESFVWDIELEGNSLPRSSVDPAASEQKNSTVILNTRVVQWNASEAGRQHTFVLASRSRTISAEFQGVQDSPRPTPSASAGHSMHVDHLASITSLAPSQHASLAPSQSASQVNRPSTSSGGSDARPALVLRHSKYFRNPLPYNVLNETAVAPLPPVTPTSSYQAPFQNSPRRDLCSVVLTAHDSETAPQLPYNVPVCLGSDHAMGDTALGVLRLSAAPEHIEGRSELLALNDDLNDVQYSLNDPDCESLATYDPEEPVANPRSTDFDVYDQQPDFPRSSSISAMTGFDPYMDPEGDYYTASQFSSSWQSDVVWYPATPIYYDQEFSSQQAGDGDGFISQHSFMSNYDSATIPSLDPSTQTFVGPDDPFDNWYATPSGQSDFEVYRDEFPTVSRVEEDVAKQLRGHWRPQKLSGNDYGYYLRYLIGPAFV
ncbi:hypothetical protein NM688_g100 [Phlebia brevispora]|uniref:Uncharacterized protein n=1 Tax=Phlebia brevispora TaxID=194682 RepID=A0ACC1TFD7_9APHY|nr:hypothetical protein NM688_g100 [Phlebia brevispora]